MVVPPSFPSSHCPLVCPLALRPHAAGLAVPCLAAYPEAQRFHPSSVCLARLLPVAAGAAAVPCRAALRAEVHPSSVCRLARLLPVAVVAAVPCRAACPEVLRV